MVSGGRGPLEHVNSRPGSEKTGHPQDQGLQQVDSPQRVEVLFPLRAAQQVAVARVLSLARLREPM